MSISRDESQTAGPQTAEPQIPGSPAQSSSAAVKRPSILQVAASVAAAAFGVQTEKNRERDFTGGSPLGFIIGGIVFTVVFVLSLVGVVYLVLP